MTQIHPFVGPVEFFSGAMNHVVTRKVKCIRFLTDATFTTLTFQFPQAPADAQAVNPNTLTYPVGCLFIWDVASFRLLTGSIQVIYNHNA